MIPNNQYYFNNGKSASVTPSGLLLSWWTSLAIKPSDALMTALNTMADGMNTDGDWTTLDLFGLVAGMETQEQQLRPLLTTSGDDFVINGVPILNANGVKNNSGTGYLELKWNPTDDGSQFTVNSCFISTYVGSVPNPGYGTAYYLGSADTALFGDSYITNNSAGALIGILNDDGGMAGPQITNATDVFYGAVVLAGGNRTLYKNATTNVSAFAAPALVANDFYGCNMNVDGSPVGSTEDSYLRHFMAGAGTANQTQIQARLNTFYTARGL